MGHLEREVDSVAEVRFPGLSLGPRAFSIQVTLVETTTGREKKIHYTYEVELTAARPRRSYNLSTPKPVGEPEPKRTRRQQDRKAGKKN